MENQRGTVALVTGGGRGLGRAFAIALSQSGMRVAVTARTVSQIDDTVEQIHALGGVGFAFPCDVTDQSAVTELVRRTETELGPVDLLVNNAGAGPPFGPSWQLNPDEWWRTIETNLRGPFLCSSAVLNGMISRKGGRIINICSGAGTVSIPFMSAYATSKAALIRLTEVLADEVRPHGVAVFAVQPGTVRTAMAEQLMNSQEGDRWLPWFKQIFDEGCDDGTGPGTQLILHLASGQADALSGSYFQAPDDPVNNARMRVLRIQYVSVPLAEGARSR